MTHHELPTDNSPYGSPLRLRVWVEAPRHYWATRHFLASSTGDDLVKSRVHPLRQAQDRLLYIRANAF